MPRKIEEEMLSFGGKSTELGRKTFLQKAAKIRQRIMAAEPDYKDITDIVMSAAYSGTLSKPAAGYSSRKSQKKGSKMPKSAGTISNVTTIAGKRGRKAEFNPADWKMEIGQDNALDVTEEMLSAVDKYAADSKVKLAQDHLIPSNFDKDNTVANKYRNNRFGAMKRAAKTANGDESTFDLVIAENSDNEKIWALVRTA